MEERMKKGKRVGERELKRAVEVVKEEQQRIGGCGCVSQTSA
jgi:hypothetical protein